MNEVDHIGANEMIFNKDEENGIISGGFNINSILMKAGMSPILTMNNQTGGNNNVSDLFDSLVIPNWALSYPMIGGEYKENEDESSDEIEDELHEKLLGLVREHENKLHKTDKTDKTDKNKKTRKQKFIVKKGGTKRKKL